MKTRIAIVILAAALVAAMAVLAYAQNTATAAKTYTEKAGWHKEWGHKGAAGRCAGRAANITLYTTTRQLTITGDGINVNLKVDVVNANSTSPYGRIVYGTGTVQLGGNTYTAKSIYGAVGPRGAALTIYTEKELIAIRYFNGEYYAVVRTFGQPGYQKYNGTATLNIS